MPRDRITPLLKEPCACGTIDIDESTIITLQQGDIDLLRSHLRRDTSGRNWTCSKSGKLLQVYRVHVYGTRKSVPYHNISSTARLQQCLLDGHDVFPIRDRALVPSVPVVLVSEVNEWAAYRSRQSTHYWSSRSSNAE